MALLLQEAISIKELAERIGVPPRRISNYLIKAHANSTKDGPCRYPEQYLVGKMLDQETRDRIFRIPLPWFTK
mgnify:CR=1 FL=1